MHFYFERPLASHFFPVMCCALSSFPEAQSVDLLFSYCSPFTQPFPFTTFLSLLFLFTLDVIFSAYSVYVSVTVSGDQKFLCLTAHMTFFSWVLVMLCSLGVDVLQNSSVVTIHCLSKL